MNNNDFIFKTKDTHGASVKKHLKLDLNNKKAFLNLKTYQEKALQNYENNKPNNVLICIPENDERVILISAMINSDEKEKRKTIIISSKSDTVSSFSECNYIYKQKLHSLSMECLTKKEDKPFTKQERMDLFLNRTVENTHIRNRLISCTYKTFYTWFDNLKTKYNKTELKQLLNNVDLCLNETEQFKETTKDKTTINDVLSYFNKNGSKIKITMSTPFDYEDQLLFIKTARNNFKLNIFSNWNEPEIISFNIAKPSIIKKTKKIKNKNISTTEYISAFLENKLYNDTIKKANKLIKKNQSSNQSIKLEQNILELINIKLNDFIKKHKNTTYDFKKEPLKILQDKIKIITGETETKNIEELNNNEKNKAEQFIKYHKKKYIEYQLKIYNTIIINKEKIKNNSFVNNTANKIKSKSKNMVEKLNKKIEELYENKITNLLKSEIIKKTNMFIQETEEAINKKGDAFLLNLNTPFDKITSKVTKKSNGYSELVVENLHKLGRFFKENNRKPKNSNDYREEIKLYNFLNNNKKHLNHDVYKKIINEYKMEILFV